MYGALGIFLYVGAEVTIGSYLVNYFLSLDVETLVAGSPVMAGIASYLSTLFSETKIEQMNASQLAGTYVFFYWGGAMVGRFIGSALLQKLNPGKLLSIYAVINILLLSVSMFTGGLISFWSILSI